MRGKTLNLNFQPCHEEVEPHAGEITFKIHKFNVRKKPADNRNIVIFPCFSEFGTEVLGTVYCLPSLLNRRYMGKYSIAVGWAGREFLYRGIVDEFWEIDEKFMWLREYCRAFHHESKNLFRIEKQLSKTGRLVSALQIGEPAVYPQLVDCAICGAAVTGSEDGQECSGCKCAFPPAGYFYDPTSAKKIAVWPKVRPEKVEAVKKFLKPNSIGITARNRKCYDRNLPPAFYERLICLLEGMGYDPVWLGERATTHPCPLSRVTDYSVSEEAKDLENTLALVSQLKFTVQFWTASTRLAGLVGTPYLLFESPDQMYGGQGTPGHEGYRLFLCTRGERKIVLTHYNSIAENHDLGLSLVEQAVKEMQVGNYDDLKGVTYDY